MLLIWLKELVFLGYRHSIQTLLSYLNNILKAILSTKVYESLNPEWATRLSLVFLYLIDIENMSFEELCYKYPKVAIEKISDDYKIYCEKAPKTGKSLNPQVDLRQPDKKDSPHSTGHKPKEEPCFV